MRTAAEIDEIRAQRVFGENFAGALRDQLDFHPLIRVDPQAVFFLRVFALIGQVARLDFPHLLLDFFEILRR